MSIADDRRQTKQKKTILLVDDEIPQAIGQTAVLERHGFHVITVYDARHAIRVLDERVIDLILMDIDLGCNKMDGTEAAKIILAEHDLPVVFLTAHSEKEYVDRVETVTNYGYVLKNSGEFVLIQSINMALRLFESGRSIRENEKKYRELYESAPIGIFLNNSKGQVLDVNPAMARMVGASTPEEAVTYFQDIPTQLYVERERREECIRILKERGYVENFEYEAKRLDGEHRWFSMNAQIKGGLPNGSFLIDGFATDITVRKRSEQRVQEQQTLMKEAHALANIGVWTWDTASDTVGWTDELYRIAGRDPHLPAPTYAEHSSLYSAESWSRLERAVSETLKTGKKYHLELELIRTDGTVRNVIAIGGARFGEKNRIVGLYGIVHDVTEYKTALAEQEESTRRFQALLESITDSVYVLDYELRHLIVNDATTSFTGYPRETFIGKTLTELFPGIERTDIYRTFQRVLQTGKKETIESPFTFEDGRDGWYEIWIYPVPEGLLCISKDITKRKREEQKLRKAVEEKEFLMNELNHRVKNNLAMITALINLKNASMNETSDLSDVKHQIDAIRIVHEKLVQSEKVTHIEFGPYVQNLLETIFSSFTVRPIVIKNTVANISIPTKKATTLGLIINEIATNAMKHGFLQRGRYCNKDGVERSQREEPAITDEGTEDIGHEEEPRFTVDFTEDTQSDEYVLILSNSGRPFPDDVDFDRPETLGLRLISELVSQLDGTITLRRRPYPVFTIRFPK